MVFSTIIFLCVFLPITIIGYYITPGKLKNLFLLICSLFFYAWGEPKFVWIMLLSIVCNYGFGMCLYKISKESMNEVQENKEDKAHKEMDDKANNKVRKLVVAAAVAVNLGILFVFKYFTFLSETVRDLCNGTWDVIQIALPIGISFYTFQGMSYVIDVYRQEGLRTEQGERISIVQKNPLNLALYISMFPQLIAGPIVRYEDIHRELEHRKHSSKLFAQGVERFIIGLGKKAILANVVGKLAEDIFTGDYYSMGAATAWIGAIAYTLQIYYDFSGYSDMAIGLGKIFGFHFMENFNYPYISRSIREFWRRWHISLSTWFRDYLYIPLGGNRRGNVYINLLIVFMATGIWHGADWGFLLWGLWHGLFILIERFVSTRGIGRENDKEKKKIRIPEFIKWIYAMLIVVVGWVLFRIVAVDDTLYYLGVMFGIHQNEFVAYSVRYYLTNMNSFFLILSMILALPITGWCKDMWNKRLNNKLSEKWNLEATGWVALKRIALLLLLALSFMFIINSSYNPFIYFRF